MNSEVFEELLHDVEYKIASRKSRDRGWCTYTDLSLLLNTLTTAQYWNLILDSFVKVSGEKRLFVTFIFLHLSVSFREWLGSFGHKRKA